MTGLAPAYTVYAPGFQSIFMPPHGNMLVPLDPAGQQMMVQHIFVKWLTYEWVLARCQYGTAIPNARTVSR